MRNFKFFQKPVKGDLSMLGGQTFATMSYDDNFHITGGVGDTPEDYYRMRRLYHTDPTEYERQRQIREDLRAAYRTNALTQEEMLRVRHQAFERMGNTNHDMGRLFIERGFNRTPEQTRIERNGFSVPTPKLKWYQRFLNELMDDEKPHKLILMLLSILGGITVFVHYYTQR